MNKPCILGSSHSNRTSWVALGEMKHGSVDNPPTIHSMLGRPCWEDHLHRECPISHDPGGRPPTDCCQGAGGLCDTWISGCVYSKRTRNCLKNAETVPNRYDYVINISWAWVCHGYMSWVLRYVIHPDIPMFSTLWGQDVQNYIDRSLLLTHGFVPIIEVLLSCLAARVEGKCQNNVFTPVGPIFFATRDSCHWLSSVHGGCCFSPWGPNPFVGLMGPYVSWKHPNLRHPSATFVRAPILAMVATKLFRTSLREEKLGIYPAISWGLCGSSRAKHDRCQDVL